MMLPVGEISPHVARTFLPSIFSGALLLFMLVACSAPAPTTAPIDLSAGKYTVLGGNPKPAQPTPSDIADLQAAQNGALQQPALVEFYSDT
jgi:hypothetical protein